ncbi:hypothetical protein [Kutzneria buriramensis]|uniref:Glycerophosphoryl diester phosphodiesterase membrane domain-containing protein n=1 Tax=Kutzneria buriramensis TaxID=1045776 RepID=A0A3E0H382_9PSEU|nr:hypothetical protein [Kutzneria buriramensis]REH37251.1 hypothetical protein BCF44_115255 [Kutzneria buriramensis]
MTDNPEPQFQFQYQQPWAPPQPGVIPLRPLDLGALFGGSFKVMFREWKPMILVPFVANLVVGGVEVPLLASAFADFPDVTRPPVTFDGVWPFLRDILVMVVVSLVLGLLAWLVTQVIATVTVSRAVLGRHTTIGQALRVGAPRMLPLFGLAALIWLIVAACSVLPFTVVLVLAAVARSAGLILLAFLVGLIGLCAGAYFYTTFALAQAALIMEPQPVLTALRRSRWLVRDNWWRIFGITLLASLMVSVVSYVAQTPLQFTSAISSAYTINPAGEANAAELIRSALSPATMIVYVFVTALVAAVGQPFINGVTTLLYHDMRIRKESFHQPLLAMSQLPDDLSPQPTSHPEATM